MSHEYALQPFSPEIRLNIDYARELNEQQLAAVTAPPGPALVIAGAGSGKTRTLTYRVAYLLEQGIPPDRILLLTFTNKAAGEMMRRVGELAGLEVRALWGGTFHSIGARILRLHAPALGYQRDFTILDREDARDLIKACAADSKIATKSPHFPKLDVLQEIFSLAANTHRSIQELMETQFNYFAPFTRDVARLGECYAERKRATNAMDFDDLLALWLKLMQEHEDVREHYQRRFQFILVDEYQDTNKLQGDLIDLLAARTRNVTVVGDDAQSIYAWRGANFANILNFPKRYPGAMVFRIETNYRSTPEILQVANAAIAANAAQFPKALAPARKSGLKPALVECYDSSQQAQFIAQRSMELHDEGVGLGQIAVLYRSHFHALELELELTRRQIPFAITSGIRFFEQAHVKDATAYMKLVGNPRDEVAFKRLAQMLPGVGTKGADKLWRAFSVEYAETLKRGEIVALQDGGVDQEQEASTSPNSERRLKWPIAAALQDSIAAVPRKAAIEWAQFAATISQLEDTATRQTPAKMLKIILEAGYKDFLRETYDGFERRLNDLEELSAFAFQFGSVEEFLTQLALLTNIEAGEERHDNTDRVRLTTIHQAKGLEFDVVFVIMLCDGLFPSSRSAGNQETEEEERRLFYVAITRAKNELYLSYPRMRRGFGGYDSNPFQEPSRFLGEIPSNLLNTWNLRS